jgi:hypothetical protein
MKFQKKSLYIDWRPFKPGKRKKQSEAAASVISWLSPLDWRIA